MKTQGPNVGEFMTKSPHTISRGQSLGIAKDLMITHHIRHLPVVDGEKLVGILTERDIQLVESLKDALPNRKVDDAMIGDPFTASPTTPLSRVARSMAKHKYGSTVIVERGKVVGVFTTIDALRALAAAVLPKPADDDWD
jgi:acetoin utilization protein AcuB